MPLEFGQAPCENRATSNSRVHHAQPHRIVASFERFLNDVQEIYHNVALP